MGILTFLCASSQIIDELLDYKLNFLMHKNIQILGGTHWRVKKCLHFDTRDGVCETT